jgi:hypothetical protein
MAFESSLPLVFAQRTNRNDRICSLLSAVLIRDIEPAFHSSIAEAFPSSIEAQVKPSGPVVIMISMVEEEEEEERGNGYFKRMLGSLLVIEVTIDKLEQVIRSLQTPFFVLATFGTADSVGDSLQQSELCLGIVFLNLSNYTTLALVAVPHLVLQLGNNSTIPPVALSNPQMVVLSRSSPSKSVNLWAARTILKYIDAIILQTGIGYSKL